MKGKDVALTDEERLYEEAKRRYEKAGRDLDRAIKKLHNWEDKHGDDNDRYRVLKQGVKDANQLLKDAERRWQNARLQQLQRPVLEPAHVGLIPGVALSEREGDPGRKRKTADTRSGVKKPRRDHDSGSTTAKELLSAIRDCNVDHVFDIESTVELPFPSLWTPPNRFQLNEFAFKYQARSELKSLYDKIVDLWMKDRPVTVNVAGTIGYGKSHMLAVLVLLLLKNEIKSEAKSAPFVCYIPDCRNLLDGEATIVEILRQNIQLNMPDFSEELDTIEEIRKVMRNKKVILVADQWNSIDDKDEECRTAKERLGFCLGPSARVKVRGMSMNASTWRALLHKQTSDDNNYYNGGLNDDEFQAWLKKQPAIFTEHEEELALLTGKVPLLLYVFARVHNDGDSWESVVHRAQLDESVSDWMTLLQKFYANIDADLVWKVITLSVNPVLDSDIVDFRFFCKDRTRGFHATSEIVMRLLYRVWTMKSAGDALLTRWTDLRLRASNPSVRGFDVEEIIKAKICKEDVAGKYSLPNEWTIKRKFFEPSAESKTLELAIAEKTN